MVFTPYDPYTLWSLPFVALTLLRSITFVAWDHYPLGSLPFVALTLFGSSLCESYPFEVHTFEVQTFEVLTLCSPFPLCFLPYVVLTLLRAMPFVVLTLCGL